MLSSLVLCLTQDSDRICDTLYLASALEYVFIHLFSRSPRVASDSRGTFRTNIVLGNVYIVIACVRRRRDGLARPHECDVWIGLA
jgi:hypothetical protein